MPIGPITWLFKAVRPGSESVSPQPAKRRGWTIPKTPVEVLAQALMTDRDWQIAAGRVHRRGISIGWKRSIESRYPGMTLRIDGRDRPLSIHESYLLARGVRHVLGMATTAEPAVAQGEAAT